MKTFTDTTGRTWSVSLIGAPSGLLALWSADVKTPLTRLTFVGDSFSTGLSPQTTKRSFGNSGARG